MPEQPATQPATTLSDLLHKLSDNFQHEDIEWKIQSTNKNPNDLRALAVAYVSSRAIQQRLDDVCGPDRWELRWKDIVFERGGQRDTVFMVGIAIRCGLFDNGEPNWVTKWDTSSASDTEPVKGAFSGSFKRAAVHWGIGRSLYQLEATWVPAKMVGKYPRLISTPQLPSWYLSNMAHAKTEVPATVAPTQPVPEPEPDPFDGFDVDQNTGEVYETFVQEVATAFKGEVVDDDPWGEFAHPTASARSDGAPFNLDTPVGFGKKPMPNGQPVATCTWAYMLEGAPGGNRMSYLSWMAKAAAENRAQGRNVNQSLLRAESLLAWKGMVGA